MFLSGFGKCVTHATLQEQVEMGETTTMFITYRMQEIEEKENYLTMQPQY